MDAILQGVRSGSAGVFSGMTAAAGSPPAGSGGAVGGVFQTVRSGGNAIFAPMAAAGAPGVTKSLSLIYNVFVGVSASLTLTYDVVTASAGVVSASLALAYVVAEVPQEAVRVDTFLDLQYSVAGTFSSVTKSTSFSYAVAGIPPPEVGIPGAQSQARMYVVTEPQVRPQSDVVGTFWNYANPEKPKGIKDPQEVIDIPFDWISWLADSEDSYASHSFRVTGGLAAVSAYQKDGRVVVFVSGGTVGATASVTCHIQTSSVPPRQGERTVYLKIKER